jgi:Rrf2 family protein
MKQLSKAGILGSHRGAGGGYSLDRSPGDISVAEIVTALEGPIALTACIDGADTSCGSMPQCAMSGNWNQVNQAIQAALDSVSLADMMPRPFAFVPPSEKLKSDIRNELQHSDNVGETHIESAS